MLLILAQMLSHFTLYFVQACGTLEIVACMKGVLCKIEGECMGILKTTMAGMAVGKFWDVLENAFGYDEDFADVPA